MEDFTVQWIQFALLTVLVFENNVVAGVGSKYERFLYRFSHQIL